MIVFDAVALAASVRTKRGHRSLHTVIEEINGISVATLSRVEKGKLPDIRTFITLCDWLDVSPLTFFQDAPIRLRGTDIIEQIETLLRSDVMLTPEFVEALMHIIRLFHKK